VFGPRPWFVPVLASLNLLAAILLLLLCAAPSDPPPPGAWEGWVVYEQITSAIGFIMAAGLFAASIGLFLWRPWARKLTIAVAIYGLGSFVVDMPYMVRYAVPTLCDGIHRELIAEGMDPDTAAGVEALIVMALSLIGLVSLAFLIVQLVYFTRPHVVAAFDGVAVPRLTPAARRGGNEAAEAIERDSVLG
jgi:hypothetical protein